MNPNAVAILPHSGYLTSIYQIDEARENEVSVRESVKACCN